ncbi:MAG: capsular polysaccharide export protein, LipB/KpsS family [Candidatus Acidiferrales bacterium]
MKILLICKGEYRYFFPQIARALKVRHGCHVSVMAFTSPASRMLEQTRAFDNVFNLAAHLKSIVPNFDLQKCVASLQALECAGGTPRVNTMLRADRIISRYPFEHALRMLAAVRQFWSELFDETQPDAIVGEIACATEWMAWLLAHRMNIHYLVPYPAPVANKCFFLASPDGVWESMKRIFNATRETGLSPQQTKIADEFVRQFRANKAKPFFLSWAQQSPLIPNPRELMRRAARIAFRFQTYAEDGRYEIGSYHGTPPWRPVWEDSMRIVRHEISEAAIFDRKIAEGPKVYFPLHVQPEFTTDVRAPFFTNQVALIESISGSVPIGYRVMVKEHPGMKGERTLGYYRQIKRICNVQLLSPSVDSHQVIQQSDAVLTITGSSAWEAILYGKPVIAFGPLCYGFGDLVHCCDNVAHLPAILRSAIHGLKPHQSEVLRMVWSFLASAYDLQWGDPIRNPQITERANVTRISDAIMEEISSRIPSRAVEAVSL